MTMKGMGEAQVPDLGEELALMRLLWAVENQLGSTSKHMRSTLGVTGPQRLVVRMLGCSPRLSASQLAELLHLHNSTLTGILKRLETRGYVVREPDPHDGRKALFSLTEAGRALDVPSTGTVEAAVQRVLFRMSEERLGDARELLTVLAQELFAGIQQECPLDAARQPGGR
jgi:MarR family transcriptional regulator, organic hydroperoxide resistance regulator